MFEADAIMQMSKPKLHHSSVGDVEVGKTLVVGSSSEYIYVIIFLSYFNLKGLLKVIHVLQITHGLLEILLSLLVSRVVVHLFLIGMNILSQYSIR